MAPVRATMPKQTAEVSLLLHAKSTASGGIRSIKTEPRCHHLLPFRFPAVRVLKPNRSIAHRL